MVSPQNLELLIFFLNITLLGIMLIIDGIHMIKKWNNSAFVTYKNAAFWNNGNVLVNILWIVQQLIASDSFFKSNYSNKKFSISKGKINGISDTTLYSKAQT